MQFPNRVISNINFCLAILLAFLGIFQDKIDATPVFQSIGRGHLLLLHLPIGILLLIGIFTFFRKSFDEKFLREFNTTSISIAASFALLTAILGLILSKEGGYDEEILSFHKRMGIITAFLVYFLSFIKQPGILFTSVLVLSLIVLTIGSHNGATLTHGEGFLQKPLMKESVESQFDENASLYQNVMKPIFDGKCTSCHNPNKLKGELDLSTIQGIKKGGKNGLVIDLNKLDSSPLIEKIHLPEENKKHMPPQGKPQLSNDEKALLEMWIARGADFEKKWKEYDSKDSLYMAAQKIISSTKSEQSNYDFKAASSTLISSLNDPFTTINPLNQNTPALHADFYVRAQYNPKKLIEFQKIKEQLVELNMGNMPVEDAEIKNIINFSNLEKLILNNSNITDNAVTELVKLPVLKSLALSGTGVTKKSLPVLQSSKSLKEVFIWNTSITAQDIDTNSTIFFYTGYVPDTSEKQALNSPAIRNESTVIDPKDSVTLYHRIPGVIIRYTLNDSLPDTFSSAIYERPLSMSRHTTVKARAMKEGWMASPVSSFSFFQKGIKPLHSNLLIAPNEKYRAQGSASLTDDVKGNIGNLIDGNWLGFRENPFEAIFEFDTITSLNEVILSINKSVGSYLVQPAYIEVFSGNDSTQMKLIKKIIPAPLTENEKGVSKNEAIEIKLDGSRAKYFMIKAMNNPKLPKWHSGKGQKGWLFVDEVFFY